MTELDQQPAARLPFRLLLWHKLALGLALLLSLVLVAAWLLYRVQLGLALQDQADRLGSALAGQTAVSITELVLANDLLSLNVVLNQLAADPAVTWLAVLNVDNEVIAAAGDPPRSGAASVAAYQAPISLQDSIAGTLRLGLDPAALDRALSASTPSFLGLWALGLGLAVLAGRVLGLHLANPLLALSQALRQRREAPDSPLPALDPRRQDELVELHEALEDYLRGEAAEEEAPLYAGSDSSAARMPATLVALRVVNLDRATELLQPSTLARLLDECDYYLDALAQRQGAILLPFNGAQALLGFVADRHEAHAAAGLDTAWLLLQLLSELGRRHRRAGSPALDVQLGVHSAELISGRLGGEPGRELLLGSALGDVGKLCALAAPGEIAVSGACRHLAPQAPFHFAPLPGPDGEELPGAWRLQAPLDKAAGALRTALGELLPLEQGPQR